MNQKVFLFIVLCSIMLLDCIKSHCNNVNIDDSRSKKIELDSSSYNTRKLIGEWGIMETISENVHSKCNACPKIIFKSDNTAVIIIPNGQKEYVKWEINNKSITFTYPDKNNISRAIDEAEYEMSFKQQKKYIELKLNQKGKKYSYILRR